MEERSAVQIGLLQAEVQRLLQAEVQRLAEVEERNAAQIGLRQAEVQRLVLDAGGLRSSMQAASAEEEATEEIEETVEGGAGRGTQFTCFANTKVQTLTSGGGGGRSCR